MMLYMPATSVELSPAEYWNSTEATRAQRLYVSFCELAAAALDYAEGLSLLRRDERRQGAARLNWAGTAFYYSLVHTARFLVFRAVGDFPTQHSSLPKAFRPSESTGVSTNWLNDFALSSDGKYLTRVSLQDLVGYWSAGAQGQQIQEIRAQLEWFADALTKAKALRNENNYEALLIAHEYRHEYLSISFKELADTMAAVSKLAVTVAVASYARVLRAEVPTESGSPLGGRAVGPVGEETSNSQERRLEAAFISRYVQNRIVEPAERWYGTDVFVVASAVRTLMEPLTGLIQGRELDMTKIEDLVSTDLFTPKARLMRNFRGKIYDLQRLLHNASTDL